MGFLFLLPANNWFITTKRPTVVCPRKEITKTNNRNMHETICCGCDVYKLAKITTILELITGNWILLAVEFYGILKKKYIPVIIVLILRVICVILGILLAISCLALSEVLVDWVDGYFQKNYQFSFYELRAEMEKLAKDLGESDTKILLEI